MSQGPLWNETLLVIVYDEHGGFYDGQYPTVTPEYDDPNFREYGACVPAFVISPWAERRFVCLVLGSENEARGVALTVTPKTRHSAVGGVPGGHTRNRPGPGWAQAWPPRERGWVAPCRGPRVTPWGILGPPRSRLIHLTW